MEKKQISETKKEQLVTKLGGPDSIKEMLRSSSSKALHIELKSKTPRTKSKKKLNTSITVQCWEFPLYCWVDEREEIWEGTCTFKSISFKLTYIARLPQNETEKERITQRKDEIEFSRGRHQWRIDPGLPGYIRSKFASLPVTIIIFNSFLHQNSLKKSGQMKN